MFIRFFSLALAAAALAACAPPTLSTGERQSAIVGGTTDTGNPGVVLMVASQTGSSSANLCTAEVVSPHVVLTAAHCLSPAVLKLTNPVFRVYLGNNIDNAKAADFLPVKETHFNERFDPNNLDAGNDVGVLIMKDPLTVKPLAMNRTAISMNLINAAVRLVGYGITSGSDSTGATAGTKRQTTTKLSGYDDVLLRFNDGAHNTCEGDSGGPAFMTIGGREVIAGITSFGDQNCMQLGRDTRIDVYASSYVDPFIVANDGPLAGIPPVTVGQDFAPGSIGASCQTSADCTSKICGRTADNGYCTAVCDPAVETSCPSGTYCGPVDNSHYCLRNTETDSGCSMAPGARRGSLAGLASLLLLGASLVLRSRSRASARQ